MSKRLKNARTFPPTPAPTARFQGFSRHFAPEYNSTVVHGLITRTLFADFSQGDPGAIQQKLEHLNQVLSTEQWNNSGGGGGGGGQQQNQGEPGRRMFLSQCKSRDVIVVDVCEKKKEKSSDEGIFLKIKG